MPVNVAELRGKVYTSREVAAVLSITSDSVRRLVREGRLRAIRLPGQRRFRFLGEDICRYLTGQPPVADGGGSDDAVHP
jgi:excisionase family DNA binding protein